MLLTWQAFLCEAEGDKGLGHAIWRAKHFVETAVCCTLGDDIMVSETPVMRQLIDLAEEYSCSVVDVQQFRKVIGNTVLGVKPVKELLRCDRTHKPVDRSYLTSLF